MKKAEEQEQLNQYKAAAFTAWRIETTLADIFNSIAGEKPKKQPDFTEFLDANRLLTPYESKQWRALKALRKKLEEREARKKHNLADIIMLSDKKRQKSLQETSKRKGESW